MSPELGPSSALLGAFLSFSPFEVRPEEAAESKGRRQGASDLFRASVSFLSSFYKCCPKGAPQSRCCAAFSFFRACAGALQARH